MKSVLLIFALFIGLASNAQNPNIKVEKQGDLYKVTYFHEDGSVSQTGFVNENKKLEGTWKSFDTNGQKKSIGHYENGKKTGRWFFWKNSEALTQVDFGENNRIASVYETKGTLNSQLADTDNEE